MARVVVVSGSGWAGVEVNSVLKNLAKQVAIRHNMHNIYYREHISEEIYVMLSIITLVYPNTARLNQ